MAEAAEKDSKTEQASEKRIRDSLDEGNVPFSREAGVLASFGGLLIALIFFLPNEGPRFFLMLGRLLDEAGRMELPEGPDAIHLLAGLGWEMLRLTLPLLLLLMLGGILASALQNPPQLILKRITPDLSRISPVAGWRRMASLAGLVEFAKNLFKLFSAALVVLIVLQARRNEFLQLSQLDLGAVPAFLLQTMVRQMALLCTILAGLVGADLVWARLRWRADLRMTRQELKDELKQLEGDPMVKARLRSLAQTRARKRMLAAVPRATLVVANPTHFAVALYYRSEEGGAPKVLAKGQDLIALRIRALAEKHGIPVFEDKALARSLYAQVEVDQMIPPEFYRAVARLITYLNRKRGARRAS